MKFDELLNEKRNKIMVKMPPKRELLSKEFKIFHVREKESMEEMEHLYM